ncbi:AKT-interacting protein isoform X2 [Anabrus simplex]|uniref:AKT-interacting protein isoform X2 n=1 Tax=Anabrus simplex TaxID=316456 RepID=UPI0035A385E9
MATGLSVNSEKQDMSEPFRRQGSFRRVLPSLPSGDSQLSMSAKMIDRPAVSSRGNQNAYKLYQQEYCIISEYNMLRKQDLPGIYVIPSAQSSLIWFGVIFVRQGIYQGGIFRFKVILPEAFPDGGCPRIVFQSQIFHPMIDKDSGELDLRNGFQEWRKNVNHIWQVLHYVRRAFYKFETKTPVNEEALEMYMNHPELFQEQLQQCIKLSHDHVYDPPPTDDPHYITFEPFDNEIHGPVRDVIFGKKDNDGEVSSIGLSWVQPGSLQPFSKPNS